MWDKPWNSHIWLISKEERGEKNKDFNFIVRHYYIIHIWSQSIRSFTNCNSFITIYLENKIYKWRNQTNWDWWDVIAFLACIKLLKEEIKSNRFKLVLLLNRYVRGRSNIDIYFLSTGTVVNLYKIIFEVIADWIKCLSKSKNRLIELLIIFFYIYIFI